MRRIRKFLKKLWTDESAISSIEYALLIAFVAAGIVLAAEELGNAVAAVGGKMNEVSDCISSDDAKNSDECKKLSSEEEGSNAQ